MCAPSPLACARRRRTIRSGVCSGEEQPCSIIHRHRQTRILLFIIIMASQADGGHLLQAVTPQHLTPYKIFVHIIEARGLISGASSHFSDALCVLQLGPTIRARRSTSVVPSTVNAVWDQVFTWDDVALSKEEFQNEKIALSVMHKSDFSRNKLIGSYEFSLGNIYRQKSHQYYRTWVPLTQPEKPENEEGHLLCSVYVLGPNDPTPINPTISSSDEANNEDQLLHDPINPDKRMFVLNVLVYRATDVLATQYGGSGGGGGDDDDDDYDDATPDSRRKDTGVRPFVSARFNGNVLQTTVAASDSADRTWNRRLELPFSLPLRSDSIELILWNKRTGLQDEIISVKSFNFFQMGLAHRAWGPRWVNLYASDYASPQTTFLGKIKHYWLSEATRKKHEYVGRMLVRMSVEPKEEALLMSVPCAPVLDPRGEDYTLQFLLYSASELPVLGGRVCVEIVFGTHRVRSRWQFARAGQAGVFDFHEKFPPISLHAPLDRSQIHHVFINLYHKVGTKVYKVAFEKVPVASLFPPVASGGRYYYLNGDTRINRTTKLPHWPTKWRTLQHVHPDKTKTHVCAGFLLACLGFGLKRDYPFQENIPKPIPTNYQRYTLRCYVHQAANLLAASPNGCSNPLLAIRFSGRSILLPCQQSDTLFPLWFEVKEISGVYVDILHAPSVYLLLLHQTTFGYVTLGRAEIAAEHIIKKPNMLCRYHVRYDQDAADSIESTTAVPGASPKGANDIATNVAGFPIQPGGSASKKNLGDYLSSHRATFNRDDVEPYVLASFELFPTSERHSNPIDANFPPKTRDFALKVESVGLRQLAEDLAPTINQPEFEVSVPMIDFSNMRTPGRTGGGGGRGFVARSGQLKDTADDEPGNTTSTSTGLVASSSSSAITAGESKLSENGMDDDDDDDLGTPTIEWKREPLACGPVVGSAIQILNAATFNRIPLPVTDPYSIPVRLSLVNAASGDPKEMYCSRFIPIADLLDRPLDLPRPPTYRYSDAFQAGSSKSNGQQTGLDGGVDSMMTTGLGSMCSGGIIGGGAHSSSIIIDEEEEMKDTYTPYGHTSTRRNGTSKAGGGGGTEINDIPREYEGIVLHVEDDDSGDDGEGGGDDGVGLGLTNGATSSSSPGAGATNDVDDAFVLELDPLRLNVGLGTYSEEVKYTREWRADGAVKKQTAAEAKAALEEKLAEEHDRALMDAEDVDDDEPPPPPKLRFLSLFRNRARQWVGPSTISEACILKSYLRCRPLPNNNARETQRILTELARDNLLNPIKPLYDKLYMARCYIYTGINLSPLQGVLDSYQSSNPYLVASNGDSAMHRVSYKAKAKRDDLNPDFFQVFDLPTKLPHNNRLEVSVWNDGRITDDMIGSVLIDLEDRAIQQSEAQREGREASFHPTTEYHDLKNASSRTSQGKLSMKIEMLTEEEARKTKPDDLSPPTLQEYELRMVIWSTRDVRFPSEEDADGAIDDVNQRVAVTTNFSHQRGREIVKHTDVAWGSSSGQADWNYRMKWRLSLPAKMPRLKIAMWHETVLSENILIGECLYNLKPFLASCLRDKKPISKTDQEWVPFIHPRYRELNLGQALVEFWLLTDTEADKTPVGEAREEPNRDPYLHDPQRNLPPWALASKGLAAMARWKKILLYFALALVIIGVAVAMLVPVVAM